MTVVLSFSDVMTNKNQINVDFKSSLIITKFDRNKRKIEVFLRKMKARYLNYQTVN